MSEHITGFQTADGVKKYDYNALANTPLRRIANVSLLASKWQGSASPYSQVVTIADITANSQVDLTPSVEQLVIFHQKDLALVAENDNGVVTVFAIGDKPASDYTMQATITEVTV